MRRERFPAVDGLRGLAVAAMLLVNNPGDWSAVYPPLRHADWHGMTPTDLIFPLFLFIVGVSIALAMDGAEDRARAARQAAVRSLRIIGLGAGLNLLAFVLLDQEWVRVWGVLQRIGLCYAAVALLALYTGPRAQWLGIAGLLGTYAVVLAITGMEPLINGASRLDAWLLGPMLHQYDPATGMGHDPEGLLATLPAIATTLIGLRAGVWLRQRRMRLLLGLAVAMIMAGAAWALWQPLNKNLWSPSFVVFAAGWSMLALAAAQAWAGRRPWPLLDDFGRNAIVAYAGSGAMVIVLIATGGWGAAYRHGFARAAPAADPALLSLLFAIAFVALWAVLLRLMAMRGVRVRI